MVRAVRHISSNISDDGYICAATDYDLYKTMWFRDSAFISSALSYAGKYLSESLSETEREAGRLAKVSSERIIGRLWSTIHNYSGSMRNAISIPYENPDLKMLKNHVPSRFGRDGNLTYVDLGNGKVLDDRAEADNPNSWIKQFDSVPLVIHATYEFVKHFGAEQISEETRSIIKDNLGLATDYMIKVYKTPCADAWEQNPHMLHSYSIAAVFMGLRLSLGIADALGVSLDRARIEGEIERDDGLKRFINGLFVHDGVLIKRREELSSQDSVVKEVDSDAYMVFAIFDPEMELLDRSVHEKTIEMLAQNEVFTSADGSEVYRDPIPRRYIGDRYFGGGAWPLLGAIKAYLYVREAKLELADNVISYIEGMVSGSQFMIPEQEPLEESILNPVREGVYDTPGKRPACDLLWSAAEYLRACTAYFELADRISLIRKG